MNNKHNLYQRIAGALLAVLVALAAFVCATPAHAQIYDDAVTAASGWNYIRYSGNVDMSGDPDTTYYTQVFTVAESKSGHSFFRVVCDGGSAEDVDVKIQTQGYPGTWETAFELKNAQGATATLDTLSTFGGAAPTGWGTAVEARMQFIPDAANDADYCQWVITLPKDADATVRASNLTRDDQ